MLQKKVTNIREWKQTEAITFAHVRGGYNTGRSFQAFFDIVKH